MPTNNIERLYSHVILAEKTSALAQPHVAAVTYTIKIRTVCFLKPVGISTRGDSLALIHQGQNCTHDPSAKSHSYGFSHNVQDVSYVSIVQIHNTQQTQV